MVHQVYISDAVTQKGKQQVKLQVIYKKSKWEEIKNHIWLEITFITPPHVQITFQKHEDLPMSSSNTVCRK